MKSASEYEYLENPMDQWHNMQWITTREYPPHHWLSPQYGVVTSNTRECIN